MTDNELAQRIAEQKYEFGFTTDVQTEIIPVGLSEDVVRLISRKKGEPEWMLDFRLKAYRYWSEQQQPEWGHVHVPPIDYQGISYYAAPAPPKPPLGGGAGGEGGSASPEGGKADIDPKLMETFDKLGIPLEERLALSGNTAVDAI